MRAWCHIPMFKWTHTCTSNAPSNMSAGSARSMSQTMTKCECARDKHACYLRGVRHLAALVCNMVEHNGEHRILPRECLEPPPSPIIIPFHVLPAPEDIEFEVELVAESLGIAGQRSGNAQVDWRKK